MPRSSVLPPIWTIKELQTLKMGWEAGWPMPDLMNSLPGRSARAIRGKALEECLSRPDWYISKIRAMACAAGNYGRGRQ